MKIKFKKMHHLAATPKYQTDGASGMDLASVHSVFVDPQSSTTIHTGLCLEIPRGFEGQIRSRSGIAAKFNVVVLNAPGTIDSDYRGEVKVILYNHGQTPFLVAPGMRIAQLVICPVITAELVESTGENPTSRGDDGLGSTGLLSKT